MKDQCHLWQRSTLSGVTADVGMSVHNSGGGELPCSWTLCWGHGQLHTSQVACWYIRSCHLYWLSGSLTGSCAIPVLYRCCLHGASAGLGTKRANQIVLWIMQLPQYSDSHLLVVETRRVTGKGRLCSHWWELSKLTHTLYHPWGWVLIHLGSTCLGWWMMSQHGPGATTSPMSRCIKVGQTLQIRLGVVWWRWWIAGSSFAEEEVQRERDDCDLLQCWAFWGSKL